jgi:hypothetical protein
MEWTITLDDENQYAEIITSGIVDKDGSLEMAKAISIALQKNRWQKVLIDHRNIKSVQGSIVDVYHRSEQFKEIGVIHNAMIALVVRPDHNNFFTFLETVCLNRGFSFPIFMERKPALDWLFQP